MKYALWFLGLLGLAFTVLKLTHQVGWSWWWVLSPLLVASAVFGFCVLMAIVAIWWIGNLRL